MPASNQKATSRESLVELVDAAIASQQVPNLIVLEPVQWNVQRGDYWVIGGPAGAGKSDLLATAAGLVRPTRGVHRLFGQELAQLREPERVQLQLRIGFVFGFGGRLFSQMTVGQNLALPLLYHREEDPAVSEERVQAVLEVLGLRQVADKHPSALDRNQQQRAALGRALMLSPELVFLDNPLGGMDVRELRWWLKLLDELARGHPILGGRPVSLVVGTGNLEHWHKHARQFALVQDRRFVVLGRRDNLSDPQLRELLPADWLGD